MVKLQQSAEQLFGAALDLDSADRCAYLDHACANAPELRHAVDGLFLAHERAGDFLEQPLLGRVTDTGLNTHISSDTRRDGLATGIPAVVESRFAPGQLIAGRFTVIRFVARGGMGEVYEVDDLLLQGVHVALKAILPHIAAEASSSRRFEQEVLLARKVTHPNLCPIYDIARSHDTNPPCLFLTMKLLAGETLAARLKFARPTSSEETIAIVRQLVAGIAAIHAAGIVHGDIKPNNLMLDGSGAAVCLSIMDFGLARLHESENTVRTRSVIAGTPGYIAPELYHGQRPSQATDLYALGVLLHVLLTGSMPECVGGLSVEPSPKLALAATASLFAPAIRELISPHPANRCTAFEKLRAHLDGRATTTGITASVVTAITAPLAIAPAPATPRTVFTRRAFAITSATAACAAAAGIAWQHDTLDNLLHPLPRKRFVALMTWPAPDPRLKPMLMSLIEAIGNELARAEAFDHDFFIIPHVSATDPTSPAQVNDIRDSLGANLVLAASAKPAGKDLDVSFQVLDPTSQHSLRTKQLTVPTGEQASLFTRSVHVAADLLDIHHYTPNDKRLSILTSNLEALAAFQAAEALVRQPNDSGLEAALEKYKEALELDSKFGIAYAKLALAYFRLYVLHRDPAALALTRANCETALSISPSLIEAHLALADVLSGTGDRLGALHETGRALTLDPTNPRALAVHGLLLVRCNRWSEAEETIGRLLRARPNHWPGHIEMGYLYNLVGRYSEAVMEFRTASLAMPKDALSIGDIAGVCLQQGKIKEAKQYAQRSLAMSENPAALVTLAQAFRSEANYKEAIRFAQHATTLDPTDPLNWLELADCSNFLPSQKSAAMNAYRKVAEMQHEELETDASDGPGWMIFALASAKTGGARESLSLVRKAESNYADDLDSQLYKIRTLELAGERETALATVGKCLHRGATVFQIETMPDTRSLRSDEQYQRLSHSYSLPV